MMSFSSSQRSKARLRVVYRAGVLTAVLAVAMPAFGSLGGSVNSVEIDRAQFSARESVRRAANYQVHELRFPDGTVVNEYISPGGTVFAVTWHGEFPPSMQQILGPYFQQYEAVLEAQPQQYGHRPLNIQEPGLVVQTGGHMRAYYGRAYVPDMLPSGVKADAIR